ncbi:MAG: anti-sigma factor antagonist [Eubacterium sp.]|nr:anti-sigma factor antagonist [Eubacterium sp.]
MNVTIESSGDLLIAYLIGEIDHHSSAVIREKIDDTIAFKKPKHLILDFKNVSFMDSSGIGLVMGRYRTMQSFKGSVEVRGINAQTKKLMELSGLSSIVILKEN